MGRRIEICAGLGTGKTTLARALANQGFIPVFEDFLDNPYLKAFYENPSPVNALHKDTWFWQKQSKQLADLKDKKGDFIIDYAGYLSMSYIDAGVNIPANKAALVRQWQETLNEIGAPDVLIVLEIPVEDQLKRIQTRGRMDETDLPRAFVSALNTAIENRLKTLPATQTVIHIDARRDFNDHAEISRIKKQISNALKAGRRAKNSYLNFK